MIESLFQQVITDVNGYIGDLGIVIVVVTIGIRAVLVPVNIIQRRQAERQREVSKESEMIRKKYNNNEKKQKKELQKLYAKKGSGMGGCLVSFIQLPVMIGLYRAIQTTVAAGTTTVLLPWVSSLLLRDPTLFLPLATLVVQMLPQIYPYLRMFQNLQMQKSTKSTLFILLFSNGLFVFAIPAGLGLYYLVSGIFTAIEQFVYHLLHVYRYNQREKMSS